MNGWTDGSMDGGKMNRWMKKDGEMMTDMKMNRY